MSSHLDLKLMKAPYIDISSLYYTDSLKIQAIEKNGLKFHVKFPDMENLQIIRMWVVTLLLSGFLGSAFDLFDDRSYLIIETT